MASASTNVYRVEQLSLLNGDTGDVTLISSGTTVEGINCLNIPAKRDGKQRGKNVTRVNLSENASQFVLHQQDTVLHVLKSLVEAEKGLEMDISRLKTEVAQDRNALKDAVNKVEHVVAEGTAVEARSIVVFEQLLLEKQLRVQELGHDIEKIKKRNNTDFAELQID